LSSGLSFVFVAYGGRSATDVGERLESQSGHPVIVAPRRRADRRRPVIAGVGAVTGYGWTFRDLVDGVASGISAAAVQRVDGVDVLASIIPRRDSADEELERFEAAVIAAVDDAVGDARARGWTPGDVIGVVHCTGAGDIRTFRDLYLRPASPKPSAFPRVLQTAIPSIVAQRRGWIGPNLVINAACASGNMALALADDWLAAGRVTDVVVLGAEFCLIAEIIEGFRRMRVLLGTDRPTTDCRPFQEGSRGFFLGEAAVAFVVSARADVPRAHYLGGASTHDAHHLVAMNPTGEEVERCLQWALTDANVTPGEVGLVKAHGSGTPLNDRVESEVADRVFPAPTRLCSFKPLVGHCMAVSALAELAALMASWESGRYPAPVTGDPAHPRLLGRHSPPPGPVVCMSVGLGGSNAAAVVASGEPT
jgi:3-oxoacyl-[acyl-carrier-protein] synthase II